MTQIRTLIADPERFRAWLQSKPGNAQVGLAGGISSCPLCRFLKEQTQQGDIWVLPGQRPCVIYGRGVKRRSAALPAWAVLTVHKMDAVGHCYGAPITADTALSLLAEVTEVTP